MTEQRMASPDRLDDFIEMNNLTSHFYSVLDARDYPSVIDCFAEDGEWFRRGSSVKGKAAITEALAHRPATFHTAHIVSNVRVHIADGSSGHVHFYLTGYPHHGEIPKGTYLPLPHAHMLTEFRDSMRKVDGHWKITEKRPVRTLYQSDSKLP